METSPVLVWYWFVASVIIGACVGSFLNVCIHRLPSGMSLLRPGSHCPACKQPIAWYDNVPIISYLLLMGRCRRCRAPISPRYLLVELLTAAAWAAAYWRNIISPIDESPDVPRFLAHALLFSALIAASFIDLEHMIIPDSVTVPVMVAGLAFCMAWPGVPLVAVHSVVPRWNEWDAETRRWFTYVVILLAAGVLYWGRYLWRRRRIPGFVGPADWVLWGAWLALGLYLVTCLGFLASGHSLPEGLEVLGRWQEFWTWDLGLLGGAASVWAFRLLGNGYLQLKRTLLAWRAKQWRRRLTGRPRVRTDLVPSQGYVMTVILRGRSPGAPWVSCAPWLAREALGFGDVTLMAAVGAILGWQAAVIAFFLSPFFAIGFSLVRFVLFGEREIPLGPFLAAATVTVVLSWPWMWPLVAERAEAVLLLWRLARSG